MNTQIDTKQERTMSLASKETREKIMELYLEGNNFDVIRDKLNISKGTWNNNYFSNRDNFANWLDECRTRLFKIKVEKVSNAILSMPTDEIDPRRLATQQKEAEFIRETLLKDHGYTKRTETIGLNVNKNEPLDDEQKKKLDNLLKGTILEQ